MLSAGLRMIQLLPVNDTSVYNMWWDSYPYSSVSVRRTPLLTCARHWSADMFACPAANKGAYLHLAALRACTGAVQRAASAVEGGGVSRC